MSIQKMPLEKDDYDTASDLQLEMMKKAQALEKEYRVYALNILDWFNSAKAEHQANDDPFLQEEWVILYFMT